MISVIVPVYNTEKYLKECIDSILAQTYSNFELLLINDGSKDNSLNILREYEEKDKRVKVFDKPNGGQSSARNKGLDNANGDYIAFIDSDDIVAPNYLEVLYSALVNTDVQMVQSKLDRFYDLPNYQYEQIGYVEKTQFSNCYDNGIKYVNCYNDSVSCKLYHKNLFDGLRFIEGEIFEDGKIIIELWLRSAVQTNMDYCGYYYRYTPNSTITTYNADKDYEQVIVWENRKQRYIEINYKNHISELDKRIARILINLYYKAKMNKQSAEVLDKLKGKIKEYMPLVKHNKFVCDWKDKLFFSLCRISPNLYVFVHKIIKKLKSANYGG